MKNKKGHNFPWCNVILFLGFFHALSVVKECLQLPFQSLQAVSDCHVTEVCGTG
jgi:hypothetical protein